MPIATLTPYAYRDHPMIITVTFGGIDITEHLSSVSDLSKSLDFPRLTEYRQGEATLTFVDPDGYFSDKREDNFFADNALTADGYGVDAVISIGYDVNGTQVLEPLFTGKITLIGQDGGEGLTDILVSDQLDTIFLKNVDDIGIERNFQLTLQDGGSIHGEYPIESFLNPVSQGSVTVSKDVNTDLTEVENISNIGNFDPDNYKVSDNMIQTEGGAIEGAAAGYPQITMKSPYRHIDISRAIPIILSNLGITNMSIYIPPAALEANFSTDGRLGYDLINTTVTGSSAVQGWHRHVTDYLFDSDAWYFLFNAVRDDLENASYLVKYDLTTYTSTVLYTTTPPSNTFSGTELWKMAKDGDNIAILAADSDAAALAEGSLPDYVLRTPAESSYNAAKTDSQTHIILYDEDTDTASTLVAKTENLAPQLAHWYVMGQAYTITNEDSFRESGLFTMFPDTRRRMEWHNNELYYAYYNKTNDRYGIAKVDLSGTTTALFQLITDGTNHAGISFIKKGTKLWVCHTRKDGDNSRITIFDEDL